MRVVLFLSSDYVFDGKKTSAYETGDARNPQSAYGRSKAEAEERLLQVLPQCCIVRTAWMFGPGGKCFPDTILRLAASRPTLDVVNGAANGINSQGQIAGTIGYFENMDPQHQPKPAIAYAALWGPQGDVTKVGITFAVLSRRVVVKSRLAITNRLPSGIVSSRSCLSLGWVA